MVIAYLLSLFQTKNCECCHKNVTLCAYAQWLFLSVHHFSAIGGHLDVVRLLVEHKADVDSQDNRKVSCLMMAFRKVINTVMNCMCT